MNNLYIYVEIHLKILGFICLNLNIIYIVVICIHEIKVTVQKKDIGVTGKC